MGNGCHSTECNIKQTDFRSLISGRQAPISANTTSLNPSVWLPQPDLLLYLRCDCSVQTERCGLFCSQSVGLTVHQQKGSFAVEQEKLPWTGCKLIYLALPPSKRGRWHGNCLLIKHTTKVRVKSLGKIISLVAETQKVEIWHVQIKTECFSGASATAAENPSLMSERCNQPGITDPKMPPHHVPALTWCQFYGWCLSEILKIRGINTQCNALASE